VIQHAIWLYLRFTLSYRDVEELLAKRGLEISYETVRFHSVSTAGRAIRAV
jgi:putative transposase